MASEAEVSGASSFVERLISSRNRDLAFFLPFILGLTNVRPEVDPDRETPDSPEPGSSHDRVILINPLTQGMVVIEGRSSGLDSLLQDLMRKDGQPPASKASIDALPNVEIRGVDEIESLGGECVICLEEWGVGDVAKEMPCKHKFHCGCVEKWLKIHGSCPVCRYKMPVEEDQDLNRKNGDEGEERIGRRRREIWVSFSFRGGNNNSNSTERPSEEQNSNQESRESDEELQNP